MSKLSKDDIDEFLGNDSFYSDQDKQRFFNKLHRQQRKKSWMPKVATAVMACVILFVGFQFSKEYLGFYFGADQAEHKWETAELLNDVESYYIEKTPGLARAEELGLVMEVNFTSYLDNGVKLHIDKIWYNSKDVYLFYYISMDDLGVLMEGADRGPRITRMSVSQDDEGKYPYQNLPLYTMNMAMNDGIIYKDRFYHRISFSPIHGEDNEALTELNDILDVDITADLFGEEVTANQVAIPVEYDKNKEYVYTSPINQKVEKEGIELVFYTIDIGVTENQLFGRVIIANGDRLRSIDATITTDRGESHRIRGYVTDWDQPEQFSFEIPPFNYEPENVTITVNSVEMISDESFDFSIDISDYEEKMKQFNNSYEVSPHEPIGEIMDTKIYLDRLLYDERGINFDILYEPEVPNQTKKLLEDTPATTEEPIIADQPLLMSAYNEQGKSASYGQRGSGPGHRFGIFLEKEFVEISNSVDITINNLLYQVKMDASVTSSVSEE
ncbi:DUF4179 domain-containing protein [Radiobacillus sp. PE A8.2]|uniref:DUF4179 domain-containing protein n=1 Tax=Radiobacillus sp. PE A8.2 TaxID=3380349 RepID=UPI00388D7B59